MAAEVDETGIELAITEGQGAHAETASKRTEAEKAAVQAELEEAIDKTLKAPRDR